MGVIWDVIIVLEIKHPTTTCIHGHAYHITNFTKLVRMLPQSTYAVFSASTNMVIATSQAVYNIPISKHLIVCEVVIRKRFPKTGLPYKLNEKMCIEVTHRPP